MIRLNLWFLPRAFLCTGAMGEAVARHSLRPLISEGQNLRKTRACGAAGMLILVPSAV